MIFIGIPIVKPTSLFTHIINWQPLNMMSSISSPWCTTSDFMKRWTFFHSLTSLVSDYASFHTCYKSIPSASIIFQGRRFVLYDINDSHVFSSHFHDVPMFQWHSHNAHMTLPSCFLFIPIIVVWCIIKSFAKDVNVMEWVPPLLPYITCQVQLTQHNGQSFARSIVHNGKTYARLQHLSFVIVWPKFYLF
jgi:hypothetical protein